MPTDDLFTEDSPVIVEGAVTGQARLCAVCQALVTPAHRLCGWHNFWWNMRFPYRTDSAARFIRAMGRERTI